MTQKNTKRILSGIRTTGPLHLGHYFGALKNWAQLQDQYECFFLLADVQALTTHFDRVEQIEYSVREVVLDFLAAGLDPEKSTFFIQSQVPELTELSMYFGMFTPLNELQKNPTVKDELKKQKDVYYGFVGYPVSQAADILLFTSTPPKEGDELLVPVGEDQVPHLESTRRTARRFNEIYGETFVIPSTLVGDFPRLPGLDMEKMGKSTGNAIFLKDSPDTVEKKIRSAFTDPKKIRKNDKGHPWGCAVFQCYKAIAPDIADELELICQKGGIGCAEDKKRLVQIVNEFLEPMRLRRQKFEKRSKLLKEILLRGNNKAREIGQKTMQAVRSAMHIDYKSILGG
jgi:tryptophanyl-tRNA synthetase